jgi:serine/threonine-protein kinase
VVDKRADIWAFGVILYEMLVGQRMFKGETISDTLAAVLTKEPEWTRVPHNVRRLLQRCLQKDPKRRLRDIGDAWELLEESPQVPQAHSRLAWLVAAGLIAAFSLWEWRRGARPHDPVQQPTVRVDMDFGPTVPGGGRGSNVVFSPDGLMLAFAGQESDGKTHLFTRRLDQAVATKLAGTEGAYGPFFSPDGRWIGFFAPGKLK